jgi:hypothetical protein
VERTKKLLTYTSVKSAARISTKAIMLTNPWYFSALIVDILFHPGKAENTFVYINVLILNAPTNQSNLSKLPKNLDAADKYKYKLHYIYREFTVDFFKMDLHGLPKSAFLIDNKINTPNKGCLFYNIHRKCYLPYTGLPDN